MHSIYYLFKHFQEFTKIFRNRNIPQHIAKLKNKNKPKQTTKQQQNPTKAYKTYDKKLSGTEDVVTDVLAKSFSVVCCWVLTGTTTDNLMGLKSESRTRLEQEEVTRRWQNFCHIK